VRRYSACFVLIACGTRPAHRAGVPFEAPQVYDSDEFIQVTDGEFPRTLIVVGGGVIGLEYASMAAALGSEVTVVEARETLLEHVDHEITEALMYHLRRNGVTFRMGESVTNITADACGTATAHLESGKTLVADALLWAIGRQPNTDKLNLDAIQLPLGERGRLSVNQHFQTSIPHIYAAGDVVGFPSLASTSMEQGRIAACHMFGIKHAYRPELLPFGIYTIPEISMVGQTEQSLTRSKTPYEVGFAPFDEVARAQIAGDQTGMLKIIFHAETLKLLGVHILGEGASELVHIGQSVMMSDGAIEALRDMVFNYPSLGEAYRLAAANGMDRIRRRDHAATGA
jgi:NAD(P) transhydrogenase